MKNAFAAVSAVVISALSYLPVSHASFDSQAFVADLSQAILLNAPVAPQYAIDWKVGDSMDHSVKMAFGNGTSKKVVTKDEGDALWMTQTVAILGQNQVTEVLLSRVDGKILKMIQNGKEVEVPADDGLEIISAEQTTIQVPAGKFECVHITAKTNSIKKLEVWANPQATCMDGSLKNVVASQFGDITLLLTKFKKMP